PPPTAPLFPSTTLFRSPHRSLNNWPWLAPRIPIRYAQIAIYMIPGLRIQAVVPTQGRVVVMSAGVYQVVLLLVVQQVRIGRAAVEAELHRGHTGQPEAMTKLFNVLTDDAQVFGNQWEVGQGFKTGREKTVTRARHPVSVRR